MAIVFYNNEFRDDSTPFINASDRSYRYGDGLFESMVAFDGNVALLPYHYERLRRSCEMLIMQLPIDFNFDWLKSVISVLLRKNNCSNARLRLQVSRRGGGLYLPQSQELDMLITCHQIPNNNYEWSSIKADFSPYRVDTGVLSNLKTTSKIQYVMSALHADRVGAQECFLFSIKGTLAEAVQSNVFLIHGNMIMTPALTNGGVDGVMRRFVLAQLKDRYNMVQSDVLMKDIDEADEIFVTNAVRGVQSVAVVGSIVYTDTRTREIFKIINEAVYEMGAKVSR
jgi:branched-chain amino acid aminotransferase